jgi:hypothetical protein
MRTRSPLRRDCPGCPARRTRRCGRKPRPALDGALPPDVSCIDRALHIQGQEVLVESVDRSLAVLRFRGQEVDHPNRLPAGRLPPPTRLPELEKTSHLEVLSAVNITSTYTTCLKQATGVRSLSLSLALSPPGAVASRPCSFPCGGHRRATRARTRTKAARATVMSEAWCVRRGATSEG